MKKKLKLNELMVNSFVTSLGAEHSKTLKGGTLQIEIEVEVTIEGAPIPRTQKCVPESPVSRAGTCALGCFLTRAGC